MDTYLFLLVNHGLQNNVLDTAMIFITNRSYFLLIIIIALFSIKAPKKGLIVFSLAAIGFFTADGVVGILKHLIARPRPCHVLPDVRLVVGCLKSFSFPSGHAATSFAAASVTGHYFRRAAVPALLVAVLVAFSRIYLGVHYPSDVIGGAVLGGFAGWFIIFIHRQPVEHRQ